ncbi:hypothetical protein [Butyrivibrio sp. JL13D10]|uniref:hypothetical protein n=1 Tax=Butyrivibrio sp. JL13D10 TaxID=3236815 RepID=UPI0038B46099
MRKVLKTLAGMVLACAITFTAMPQTVEAAAKITTVEVGQTKKVQTKLYKGAKGSKAKVSINEKRCLGTAYGLNLYYVDMTVKNPKLTSADAVGVGRECKKKGLDNFNSFSWVLTNKAGQDVNGSLAAIAPSYSTIEKSSSVYKAKGTYTQGFIRYHQRIEYAKSVRYKMTIGVSVNATDVYFGIAGLKKGQPSWSKSYAYSNGQCTFNAAGFGGNKKNIVATRLQ